MSAKFAPIYVKISPYFINSSTDVNLLRYCFYYIFLDERTIPLTFEKFRNKSEHFVD